jgi:PAS domain S-box-containing protein
MIASGHAYFVRDFQAEPQFVLLPGLGWMRSTVGAPLRTKERVIGSIHLDSAEPGLFDQTHAEWLQAFADLAGTAVQNAQLYANTRLHALQLEQRVNERTAAFQRAKTQVETILNTSSDSILLIDERGRIQQANPAFMRLSGYDGESVFGRPLFAFVSVGALGLLNAALERALTGEQCRAELVIARDGGEHVTVDAAFDPVRTFKGEAAIVCTMHDITDRQRIESELRRALEEERRVNDLKRFFSITVSHEFRTPLQIIQSASDKLSRYLDRLSDESRREALHNIETQVQHLKSLLDDIMTVSKAETVGMEFEPVATDLNGFIGEIVGEMRWLASNQHQLDYHGQACPNASIDPQLMRRVLTNLISNAMKYSPAGTAIEVSLSCTEAQAFIDVRDHGIGIPEGDQDRLFEMFHRARNAQNVPGTGLGLAIVRRAVELHGGTISFSSRVNEGTTFTIALPLSGAAGGPPG